MGPPAQSRGPRRLLQAAKTLSSGILKEWTGETVPELATSFGGRPALAEWVLSVEQADGTGYVRDWWLDVTTHSCLDTPRTPHQPLPSPPHRHLRQRKPKNQRRLPTFLQDFPLLAEME